MIMNFFSFTQFNLQITKVQLVTKIVCFLLVLLVNRKTLETKTILHSILYFIFRPEFHYHKKVAQINISTTLTLEEILASISQKPDFFHN